METNQRQYKFNSRITQSLDNGEIIKTFFKTLLYYLPESVDLIKMGKVKEGVAGLVLSPIAWPLAMITFATIAAINKFTK